MAGDYLPPVVIDVVGDIRQLLESLSLAQGELEDFARETYTTNLDARIADLSQKVVEAGGYLRDTWSDRTFEAKLSANIQDVLTYTDMATTELVKFQDSEWTAKLAVAVGEVDIDVSEAEAILSDFAQQQTTARLYADLAPLRRGLSAAQTLLESFGATTSTATLTADLAPLEAALLRATTLLKIYDDDVFQAILTLDTTDAGTNLTNFRNRMKNLADGDFTIPVGIDLDQAIQEAMAAAVAIKAEVETVIAANPPKAEISVDVNTGEIIEAVSELELLKLALESVEEAQKLMSGFNVDGLIGGVGGLTTSIEAAQTEITELANRAKDLKIDFNIPSLMTKIGEVQAMLSADPLTIDIMAAWANLNFLQEAVAAEQAVVDAENATKRWGNELKDAKNTLATLVGQASQIEFKDNLDEIWLQAQELMAMVNAADPTIDFKTDFDKVAADLKAAIDMANAQARLSLAGETITRNIAQVDNQPEITAWMLQMAEARDLMNSIVRETQADPDPFSDWLSTLPGSLDMAKIKMAELAQQFDTEMEGALGMLGPGAGSEPGTIGQLHYQLMLDALPAQAEIDKIKLDLAGFASEAQSIGLDLSTGEAYAHFSTLQALLSMPITVEVDADIHEAMAKLTAFIAAARTQHATVSVTEALAGGAAGGSGGGGGGGAAGVIGLLGTLGWGKGGNLGGGWLGIPSMASFGSVLGMAGFGAEHLAMTGVGIGGSLVGAGLGGAALGATSLGVAGAGMATDAAGIGQAFGDAKTYTTDMDALNQAIAEYGANSTQAQQATYQFQQDMAGLSSTTVAAVGQLSQMGQKIHDVFDKVTGPAETIGAQILTQLGHVALGYLPLIGKYATENMTTIKKDIQPFFQWLSQPAGGMGVFTSLEDQFQKNLPTAIHAFTQAFELVGRTMQYLAPQTGRLVTSLDHLFTHLNGSGFSKWLGEVQKVVDQFRVWEAFFKVLIEDIAKLFGLTAGLAAGAGGIIPTLTGYLTQLHRALMTTGKGSDLGQLFATHKQEVIELIKVLVQLGTILVGVYLQAAPIMVRVATIIIELINGFLTLARAIPGGAEFIGFAFLAHRMGMLSPLLKGAASDAGLLQTAIGKLGFAGLFSGENQGMLTKLVRPSLVSVATSGIGSAKSALAGMASMLGTTTIAWGEMGMAAKLATVGGIMVAAVIVYELIKHFGVLPGLIISGALAVTALGVALIFMDDIPVVAFVVAIGLAIVGLIAAIIWLVKNWSQVWAEVKRIFDDATKFLRSGFGDIVLMAMGPVGAIIFLALHWQEAWSLIKSAASDAWGFIQDVFHAIEAAAGFLVSGVVGYFNLLYDIFVKFPATLLGYVVGAGEWLLKTGENIVEGLIRGIGNMAGTLMNKIKGLAGDIIHSIGSFLGIASPSTITTQMGSDLTQGLANGITNNAGSAVSAARTVSDQIVSAFGSLQATGTLATSVGNLQKVFGNLGQIFDTLGTTANSSKNVSANITIISAAMRSLQGVVSTGLVSNLNSMGTAFKGLGDNKSLQNIQTQIGTLGKLFDTVGRTAQSAKAITVGSLQAIGNAIFLVTLAAPGMVSGISQMTSQFMSFANTCTPGAQSTNKELANIGTTLGKLGGIFTAFANLSSTSSKITASGMQGILTALTNLNDALPWIMVGLEQTKRDFDKFHDWKALFGDLNNLIVLFGKVNQVFQDVGKAAQSGEGVTVPALDGITKALQDVSDSLSGFPASINSAGAPILTALNRLVGGMHDALTSPTVTASFVSAGQNMMLGLQQGINSAASGAAVAAANAAKTAVAAANTATKTSSPSLVFDQMGRNWMSGLVQGIEAQKTAVSAALIGVTPSVGSSPRVAPMVSGGGGMTVTANFTIHAPGGDVNKIKTAIQQDSATKFAQNTLIAIRSGAGSVYS